MIGRTIFATMLFIFFIRVQSGAITGNVTNNRGEGICKVKVVVTDSLGVTLKNSFLTDCDGRFDIPNLAPGKYNLQFSEKRYLPETVLGVQVNSDKLRFINIHLDEIKTNSLPTKKGKKK